MNHVSLLAATVSMGRLHDTLVHSRSADRPRLLAEHQDPSVQGAGRVHAVSADAVTMRRWCRLQRQEISSRRDQLRIVATCA